MERFYKLYVEGNEPLPPAWTELNMWGELIHNSVIFEGEEYLNPIHIREYLKTESSLES